MNSWNNYFNLSASSSDQNIWLEFGLKSDPAYNAQFEGCSLNRVEVVLRSKKGASQVVMIIYYPAGGLPPQASV